jgi:uncharacterized protein YhaN
MKMGIRIEEINAQGVGPLAEFSGKLGDLNLIYGKNEKGKTYLVEFIIKSLFKNNKEFLLRSGESSGKVIVSGLGDQPEVFSPKSPRKLEDFLLTDHPGMPTNVSRLLVVKGAELSLDNKKADGISKSVIKSFLTSENKLDQIQKKIQKTIQSAVIEDGIIQGNRTGDLKTRSELDDKLQALRQLQEKVNQSYSEGVIAKVKETIDRLETEVKEQINAKRYLAYTISQQQQEIENFLIKINAQELIQLRSNYDEWNRQKSDLEDEAAEFEQTKVEAEQYPWLETAVEEYEKFMDKGGVSPKKALIIIGSILIGLGLLVGAVGGVVSIRGESSVGFVISTLGMSALMIGLILCGIYFRSLSKKNAAYSESEELDRISEAFQEKFDRPLKDLATLKAMEKEYHDRHSRVEALVEVNEKTEGKIRELAFQIESGLQKLGIWSADVDEWKKNILTLESQMQEWDSEKQETKVSLASLGVEERDFIAKDPGRAYEKQILLRVEEDLKQAQADLREEEQNLELLKTEVQTTLRENEIMDWVGLFDRLLQEINRVSGEYQSVTSKILAGITVNQMIEEVRTREDENIMQQLKSPNIQTPLSNITSHYQYLTFEGETIRVGDKYEEFDVGDLSTGAQEQVLLALRLGFVHNLIGDSSAFLILDDAFQHSDWTRRENLISQMVGMVESGWQVIYFTMDDHIRDLFMETGQKNFGKQYKQFILGEK